MLPGGAEVKGIDVLEHFFTLLNGLVIPDGRSAWGAGCFWEKRFNNDQFQSNPKAR